MTEPAREGGGVTKRCTSILHEQWTIEMKDKLMDCFYNVSGFQQVLQDAVSSAPSL